MRIFTTLFIIAIYLIIPAKYSIAQLIVDHSKTADELVQSLLGQGVTYSNAVLEAHDMASGVFSNGGGTSLGLNDGIVFSSGNINTIPNAATFNSSSGFGYPGDSDLTALAGVATHDASKLSFDFVPQGDSLFFEYVFASEEYPEYVGSSFVDVFAFFITGPKPGGAQYQNENVALVPGSQSPVSINTINPNTNSQYYIDNSTSTTIAFDGLTVVLQISLAVVPYESYHIKMAIADGGDDIYDSGVFLKANSFKSPTNYYPLVEDEKEWNVMVVSLSSMYPWDTSYFTMDFKTEGDSILNDILYNKVYMYHPYVSPEWEFHSLMREDENRKVYTYYGEDLLYYDFYVDLGDTVYVERMGGTWGMVVDDIDSVMVESEIRKRWNFHYADNNDITEYWIEGIGSSRGIVFSGSGMMVGGWQRLLCMHHMGDLIYMNPAYNSCYMNNVSVEEHAEPRIEIYPNPASEVLGVKCWTLDDSEYHTLYIYDAYGRIHKEVSSCDSRHHQIDVSNFPPGIYILSIETNNRRLTRRVIIK